jgi:hypothetical protein
MSRAVVRLSIDAERAVLAIGAAAGVGVLLAGPRPTGQIAVDAVLVIAAVTGCVWASASAPWWSLIVLAGLSGLLADPLWAKVAGGVVFVAALYVGAKMRSQPVPRAVLVGASLVVLATAGDLWKFGISSLIGIGLAVAVAVLGLSRRPSHDRRLAIRTGMVAGGVAVIGVAGLAVAGLTARDDLSAGNTAVREGLRLAKEGEFDAAQASFEMAALRFREADSAVTMPWAQISRVVPIAAQHRSAADDLAGSAAAATRTLDVEMRQLDLDALQIVDSRIDIDAVVALREPMLQVQKAIDGLDQAMADSQNGWLVPPVSDRLTDLAIEVDDQQVVGQRALDALDVAPAVLGAEGERVYFVMFTTPAEARGQGGFMGNYAEITIDQGRIEMTEFGSDEDLNAAGERPRRLVGAPEDWLARYGPFGFAMGADKLVGEVPWKNITMSPNFPATAQVVAELYPQSGGKEIDGVISLDVFALEQLVGLVGPLEITGAPEPLTTDNTSQFLLFDQYSAENSEARSDMLEQVARGTVERLLMGAPPDPLDLAKAMAPMVEQRRVYAWSANEREQSVVTAANADGELLDEWAPGSDGLSVAVVNASGNKIESFLERNYQYDVELHADGTVQGTLMLRFANESPEVGYPGIVISNSVGLPDGWSRIYVTVFSAMQLCGADLGGEPALLQQYEENGVRTYSTFLDLPPSGSAELRLDLAGVVEGDEYKLQVEPQPLVNDEGWEFGGALRSADVPAATTRPFKLAAQMPDELQYDDSRTLTCT